MRHTVLFALILLLGWGDLLGPAQAAPFAYLTHWGDLSEGRGRVTVIDTATHTVIAHVPVDGRPGNVAVHPAGTRVYVATNEGNTVAVIDTATHTAIATIPVPDGPTAVTVHPAGTGLYVARAGTAWLSVIDTTTHATVAEVQMPHRGATTMAIHPAGTTVYVTHPGRPTLTVIDTATHTAIDTDGDWRNGITGIPVGGQPIGVAVHPTGTVVYVADQASHTVAVIDTATHRVIDMAPTPSTGSTGIAVGRDPVGVAVHPAGTRVYVANGDCTVSVIAVEPSAPHTQSEVIDTIPVDDCDHPTPITPWGLAVTPDGTAVYVANAHDSGHPILDTTTHQLLGLIHEADGQTLAEGSEVLSPFIGPTLDPEVQERHLERAMAGRQGGQHSAAGAGSVTASRRQLPSAFDPSSAVFNVDQAAIRFAGLAAQGTLDAQSSLEPPTCGMSTSPTPHAHVLPSQPVGHVPATFQPSEFTGAATFAIPMNVPPGRAGMQPALALTYSSSSSNGPVGVGWSLSGGSRITRCAKTFAQDGQAGAITFTAEDRFCLDGVRLVAIQGDYGANGTEYRTELDQNLRIIGRGGPGTPVQFEVFHPNGRRASYGSFGNSIAVAFRQTVPDERGRTSALSR